MLEFFLNTKRDIQYVSFLTNILQPLHSSVDFMTYPAGLATEQFYHTQLKTVSPVPVCTSEVHGWVGQCEHISRHKIFLLTLFIFVEVPCWAGL